MRRTMNGLRVCGAALLTLACTLSSAPVAHAQSDADRENAQVQYKAGNDARDAGDMKTAVEKYKIAYALVQTPVIAVALGKAELAVGQLIEARQTFLGVDRLPVKPKESALTTAARTEASTLAGPIEARIPTVTLKVARPAGTLAPSVTIDGVAIPELALEAPRKVNPGAHTVVATLGAARSEVPFQMAEGETREVPVPFPAGPAEVAPVVVAPVASTTPASSPSHVPAYIAFGVGGAGLVVTTVFGIFALGKKSKLSDCSNNVCPSTDQSNITALNRNAVISDIGLGVAIAGAGAGVLLWLLERPSSGASTTGMQHFVPWVGPGAAGVRGSF